MIAGQKIRTLQILGDGQQKISAIYSTHRVLYTRETTGSDIVQKPSKTPISVQLGQQNPWQSGTLISFHPRASVQSPSSHLLPRSHRPLSNTSELTRPRGNFCVRSKCRPVCNGFSRSCSKSEGLSNTTMRTCLFFASPKTFLWKKRRPTCRFVRNIQSVFKHFQLRTQSLTSSSKSVGSQHNCNNVRT